MRRDTRSAYRARTAATERSVDEAVAEVKAAEKAEQARLSEAYAERIKPVPYTAEQLAVARAVRTPYGWYGVLKVNAKTVTAYTDFGPERIPIETILEVRV